MEHLRNLETRYGIQVKVYNPIDVSTFEPTLKAKLIWLEAAGSVTLEFPDLVNLVKKPNKRIFSLHWIIRGVLDSLLMLLIF